MKDDKNVEIRVMLVIRLKPVLIATATVVCASPALAQADAVTFEDSAMLMHAEAPAESPYYPISFEDPEHAFTTAYARGDLAVELAVSRRSAVRPFGVRHDDIYSDARREFALALAAGHQQTGLGLDVSVQRRARFNAQGEGDVAHAGNGSELRLGRGLVKTDVTNAPTWYVFAASDDEALTWRPGGLKNIADAGALALRDRVEIGDMQAGVTYQRGTMQASFAYVERDVSVETGLSSISREEHFTGITLTLTH